MADPILNRHSREDGKPDSTSSEKLITQHIDIWTTAIKQKSSAGRGSSNKYSLYGIKKLRELILELAVRGKLVPQDVNDEPALILLERIDAEKAQLVKEGKLKIQKPLPQISEDEKPFELPQGWEWCRLIDIASYINGFAFKSSSFKDTGVGIVKIGDISFNGELTPETMSRVDKSVIENLDQNLKVEAGDLVIAMSGATTGKLGFNKSNEVFYLNQRVGKFVSYQVNIHYLYLPLTTKIAENLAKSTGSAIPNLSTGQINEIVFALPPLEEQHLIVAKVDELMSLCDALEAQTEASIAAHQTLVETLLNALIAETSGKTTMDGVHATHSKNASAGTIFDRVAEHFDTLFTTEASIDTLKQTILQLAVMGKLVPQASLAERNSPNYEPAAKLLERIAAEKAQLIKDGKIKKQKPLPAITDEEKPFELPLGWEWCRISDASLFTEYGTSEKAIEGVSGVPVLKMGDIQQGKVLHGGQKIVPETIEDLPNLYLKYGDVLYNRTNSPELVGKTGMFEGESDSYTFASYLIRIRCHFGSVRPQYLTLVMNSPLFRTTQIDPHIKQQCGQANVNGTIMKSMLVPICPLQEQHRIVAKVDDLMALCDQLKARLSDAQTTQLHLTDAIIEQAI